MKGTKALTIKLIAEIGINHKGSMSVARKMVRQAAHENCWGVKFQYRHLDSFYQSSNEIGDGIIIEELERINLTIPQFVELAVYAKELGIKVGVSFFRVKDVDLFGDAIEFFDFVKVPSAECCNAPLLERLTLTNKQIMVSTGGHNLEQIKKALLPLNVKGLVVFHCIANYPVKLGAQSLRFINTLSDIGFTDVGYSSHDEDVDVCLIAMSLGAKWIERHLTEDLHGSGLDDSSSSEIKDFQKLAYFASSMNAILGDGQKTLNQGEILNMQNLGTGLYARCDLQKGKTVNLSDFAVKAPRVGLSVAEFLENYQNISLTMKVREGKPLEARSFSKRVVFEKPKLLSHARNKLIGIPVRLHDFTEFKGLIETGTYEFHLSYQECMGDDLDLVLPSIDKTDNISIHLPDYLPGNVIIDPVSDSLVIRNRSRDLIETVTKFARRICQKTGREIPIVGSFSQTNNRSKTQILNDLFDYLDERAVGDFEILPQWLPVYAWYFGGAVKLDLFNSRADIDYIVKHKRPICMDICHLALSANYFSEDWKSWYQMLKPFSKHFHLADATGVDGEGLPLGEGDIKDFDIFQDVNGLKIIEVWQGHFNDGAGFLTALETLSKNMERKL
ncbi:N-acetylneuraminate synthase family protein [Alphaproteobacteria bacterium]|nr:N-acetylneuraminate synthase family protein [Alphaproteobacteria bacterium]